jgi:uncharacterized membrane protein YkoI
MELGRSVSVYGYEKTDAMCVQRFFRSQTHNGYEVIMKTRVAIGILLSASAIIAAEKKVQMKDLPAAVQRAVQEQSKGATLRGLTKEVENGKTEYEAALTVNGHNKDISFDAAGKIISIEEEVPLASIPEAARGAIQKAAGAGKVQNVEQVNENGKVFYEAHILKGGKSSEFQVDVSGNAVRQ